MGWLSGIANVGGSILDFVGGSKQNASAKASALEQERFQRDMSDSAHQREVSDLRAAGLNPLLSTNAGASTPSGAQADVPAVPLQRFVASSREQARLDNDLATSKAQRRQANAVADMTQEEVKYMRAHPDEYFAAKQGIVNTIGSKAAGSISSSAKSVGRSADRVINRILDWFGDSDSYISQSDAKSLSASLLKQRKDELLRRKATGVGKY